jgi:hypothetical protein
MNNQREFDVVFELPGAPGSVVSTGGARCSRRAVLQSGAGGFASLLLGSRPGLAAPAAPAAPAAKAHAVIQIWMWAVRRIWTPSIPNPKRDTITAAR